MKMLELDLELRAIFLCVPSQNIQNIGVSRSVGNHSSQNLEPLGVTGKILFSKNLFESRVPSREPRMASRESRVTSPYVSSESRVPGASFGLGTLREYRAPCLSANAMIGCGGCGRQGQMSHWPVEKCKLRSWGAWRAVPKFLAI